MSRVAKQKMMTRKKKLNRLNDLSVADAENFEPPQQSSTPAKFISKTSSKRVLKDNNSLNISVITKQDKKQILDIETPEKLYKPSLPVIEESYKYDRVPELFCSDPEEEEEEEKSITTDNKTTTVLNDSEWMTFSGVSESNNGTNVSDILAEIDADIKVRFEKPPRRSYPGRKRNNKSMFEDIQEEEQVEVKATKKLKKPKQKKKANPEEEALIQSINEHFNDVETFSLIVE